jgi:hypothetical protein
MSVLESRILSCFARFDGGDKGEIAKELVDVLEWQPKHALSELVRDALGRELTQEEAFKIQVLELIAKDRGLPAEPDRQDDFGAPKMGF